MGDFLNAGLTFAAAGAMSAVFTHTGADRSKARLDKPDSTFDVLVKPTLIGGAAGLALAIPIGLSAARTDPSMQGARLLTRAAGAGMVTAMFAGALAASVGAFALGRYATLQAQAAFAD